MKQCFFILILSLCFFKYSSAQTTVKDSLLNDLALSKPDTHRVNILNDLAYELSIQEPLMAIDYAKKAFVLSDNLNFPKGKADALTRLGMIEGSRGNYLEADTFFQDALKLRIRLNDSLAIGAAYGNLALIHSLQDNYEAAVEDYLDALRYLKNKPISKQEANTYVGLSDTYKQLGEYELSLKAINQGISIYEELKDTLGKAGALINLGNWYETVSNFEKAEGTFLSSISLFKKSQIKTNEIENGIAKCYINMGNLNYKQGSYELAIRYFEQAINLKDYITPEDLAMIYQNKGNILMYLGENEEATKLFNISLDTFTKIRSNGEIASVHLNLGLIDKYQENYTQAISHFQKSETILDTIANPLMKMQLAKEMAVTYAQLKQTDLAFEYSQKHMIIRDSLDKSYTEAMNYKSDFEEAKYENELLEEKHKLQVAKTNSNLLKMKFASLLFIIGLAAAVYITYRQRKIVEQKVIDAQSTIDKLLKDKQVQSVYDKLQGQVEERKRVAQSLHDGIGSILSTIKLYLKDLNPKPSDIVIFKQQQFQKVNELIDFAVIEVRKIAQNVEAKRLTTLGLKSELTALAKMLKDSKNIKVQAVTNGLENQLPIGLEIKAYRIIQELISNILKHAQASSIEIQVNRYKESLNIIVEDDGKGFDTSKAKENNGTGLRSIESRISEIEGTLDIHSAAGKGTTVSIEIPLLSE